MISLTALLKKRGWDYDEIMSLRYTIHNFFIINWIKTLWYNFKVFPFSQAIKVPLIISYNVNIKHLGKIKLSKRCFTGMISLGVNKIDMWEDNSDRIIINNDGIWNIAGRVKVHPGSRIYISKKGTMTWDERVSIGSNTKIVCMKCINIGHDFRISWNSQIFDTDFHFFTTLSTNKVHKRIRPVSIGDEVFVGNSCTIGKGVVLPNGSTVSCCSKVNGDFSNEGSDLLIIGNPAKVVGKGFRMGNSWFPDLEKQVAVSIGE